MDNKDREALQDIKSWKSDIVLQEWEIECFMCGKTINKLTINPAFFTGVTHGKHACIDCYMNQRAKLSDSKYTKIYSLETKDLVNHPPHYTSHPSGIEAIEITQHEDFLTGNALKYILRHKLKGKPVEDLEKAIWYLKRRIEILKTNGDKENV